MKYLLLGFLVAVSLFSCNTTTTDPGTGNPDDVIWPVKVGNMWIYQTIEYDSNAVVLAATPDTLSIVGEVTIGGSTWALMKRIGGDTISVQNRANGMYWSTEGKEVLACLYPTKPGDRFFLRNDTIENAPRRTAVETVDVETINSSVTVPAGTFSCVKYSSFYEEKTLATGNVWRAPQTRAEYIAPNKGLIQMIETTRENSGKTWISRQRTLQSISLK